MESLGQAGGLEDCAKPPKQGGCSRGDPFVSSVWLECRKSARDMMKPSAPEPPRPPAGGGAPEIMTIPQVAEYLCCHYSTIHRLAYRRKIPGFRLGSDWRFRRADIDTWIVAQEIKVTFKEAKADGPLQRARGSLQERNPSQDGLANRDRATGQLGDAVTRSLST
jgi:excisionase family DNA binding protein